MNRSLSKVLLAVATTLIAVLGITSVAAAVPDRPPIPPPTTFWQNQGFMLMAHQGGEWDYPPNTLFSYKSAAADGADVIDMDAYVTQDKQLVLTHDLDARKNSNLTDSDFGGAHNINDLTVAQLKTLDFAYKWSPHDGSSTTPWKGVATGSVQPPAGFTANDFKIPTFDEVLAAFPNTPINIELKQVAGVSIDDTVTAMANALASHPGHDDNVIINSFGQDMLTAMAAKRPQHKAYSGSQAALTAYLGGTPITPTPVALEPPDQFNLGSSGSPNWVDTVPLLKPNADYDGYKMYVWGSDHDPQQDTAPFYDKLVNQQKVDSYNTPDPIAFANWLCTNGTPKPDGSPRCSAQVCPAGQTGIAPNNCKDIPPAVCPEGQTGTPPNCVTPPAAEGKLKKSSGKWLTGKKVKAGKKAKYKLTIKNSGTGDLTGVKVCASVPKKKRKTIKVGCSTAGTIAAGKTKAVVLAVNTTKKAKGNVKISIKVTAKSSGGGNASPLYDAQGLEVTSALYQGGGH